MAPSSGSGVRQRHRLYLVLALAAIFNVVCWRAIAPLSSLASSPRSRSTAAHLAKRSLERLVEDGGGSDESEALIDWLAWYTSAAPGAPRVAIFALMVLWLIFLFAFVGICASEFFCPNLSHIASRLGLSESVAGVTFLAFSNGSPDVFSTFAALRNDSGSLAIGELIGAASFIVSVVAGTMALIKPFRVARRTFLRDIGFFSIAVLLTLGILYDSHIHLWEAFLMVGLYAVYVLYVAVGTWWEGRVEAKRKRLREARGEYEHDEAEGDIVNGDVEWEDEEGAITLPPSGTSTPSLNRSRSYRDASPAYSSSSIIYHPPGSPFASPPMTPTFSPSHSRSRATSLSGPAGFNTRPPPTPLMGGGRRRSRSVRPSLLGAIEFRDVVNSLSSDRSSAANILSVFGGAHQHHPHSHEVLDEVAEEHEHALEEGLGLGFGGASDARGRRRALSQPEHPGALQLGGADDVLAERVMADAERRRQRMSLGERRGTWTGRSATVDDEEDERGLVDLSKGVDNPWKDAQSPLIHDDSRSSTIRRVPSILLTTDSGSDTILADHPSAPPSTAAAGEKPKHRSNRRRLLHAWRCALFPSLQSFRSKSIVGKCTALLCVPALLVLNLTLPVVEEPSDEGDASWNGEKADREGGIDAEAAIEAIGRQLHSPAIAHTHADSHPHPHAHSHSHAAHDNSPSHRLQHIRAEAAEAEAPSPSHAWEEVSTTPLDSPTPARALATGPLDYFRITSPNRTTGSATATPVPVDEDDGVRRMDEGKGARQLSEEELEDLAQEHVTRVLTALQCFLGPLFVVSALFVEELRWWYLVAAGLVGLLAASVAYRFFHNSRHPGRVSLCFLGFAIAMVWILMIVNEVVGVLLTLGHIFGISDAILGLTIFAMGNSLGDLVANATVARMGYPTMAIAACFGGPMLNILLGVGLSGTYLILFGPARGQPIHVPMSKTLLVSGVGLFAILVGTLVVVPLNGYRMSKRVGAALIAAWMCVMAINVGVEIWA
ncbi:putative cation exchanger [Rhodotorula toruloides]|uniref:Sodium/calcium exchanger protein-domain containing protein n=1 Tax=Rhodotorula toruloides TaxID=5286 RepID=A0A2S9ZW55_RHOTO|nr:putative cation exchanger [Rhodotorula toruloides]PRQ69988.1 Sodium/calcium exchanger protein-domain containing protein [Rhodotorula toruloides]